MALTIEQITAVAYPMVLADKRGPANQWAENAALRALEKGGFVERKNLGENIEAPLDYRANPDTAILASDQDTASLTKTEVLTSAVFEIAQLNVPVTWTKGDEAKTPTENEKVDFSRARIENALTSHDDQIETCVFTSSTVGGTELNGLNSLVPTSGQGTVGGIDASVETFWRNPADTYQADGSDIEAVMSETWNDVSKGTGGMQPTLLLSGSSPHVLYESQLQAFQRFMRSDEADAGFKALAFHGAPYVFSHKGGSNIYMLNPKNYKLVVSRQYFRDKGSTEVVPGQNAFYFLLYSALQFITNNKSRLGVIQSA